MLVNSPNWAPYFLDYQFGIIWLFNFNSLNHLIDSLFLMTSHIILFELYKEKLDVDKFPWTEWVRWNGGNINVTLTILHHICTCNMIMILHLAYSNYDHSIAILYGRYTCLPFRSFQKCLQQLKGFGVGFEKSSKGPQHTGTAEWLWKWEGGGEGGGDWLVTQTFSQ